MTTDLPGLGVLTTDHAASSHGVPVLVVGGAGYGPGDAIHIPSCKAFAGCYRSTQLYEAVLGWFRSHHARREADCGLGAPRGKLVWVDHCPACERIMDAIDAWLAPVGLHIDRGTLDAVDVLREPKS